MTLEVGTRIRVHEKVLVGDGTEIPAGSVGTVIPMEGRVASLQWAPTEFAIRMDDASRPEGDLDWLYYDTEKPEEWELVTDDA